MTVQRAVQLLFHGFCSAAPSVPCPPCPSCCSDKERARGDHEVWGIDSHGNVGQYDRTGKAQCRLRGVGLWHSINAQHVTILIP